MSTSRVQAKICGLSTPEAVAAALAGKAAYLGFVFFPKSPRNVTAEVAARLAAPARGPARIVAVMVDPSDGQLDEVARVLRPDLIQLHGHETPARVHAVAARAAAEVIKAVPVADSADVAASRAFEGAAAHLMFDAKPPRDAALPGGVGARFDWTLLAGQRFQRPWFLAGGLDPWNVEEAVSLSAAPVVDVSSGVERGPGLKDPALIAAFLDAVRRVA
jgi:phosphoribosylanthranilate isomerase